MEHVTTPDIVDPASDAAHTSPERKKMDFVAKIADARAGILSVLDDMKHE